MERSWMLCGIWGQLSANITLVRLWFVFLEFDWYKVLLCIGWLKPHITLHHPVININLTCFYFARKRYKKLLVKTNGSNIIATNAIGHFIISWFWQLKIQSLFQTNINFQVSWRSRWSCLSPPLLLRQLLGKQYERFKLFIWLYNSHILYQIGNEIDQCNIILWLCYHNVMFVGAAIWIIIS